MQKWCIGELRITIAHITSFHCRFLSYLVATNNVQIAFVETLTNKR